MVAKSLAGAGRGVKTAQDMIDVGLALGSDAITGAMPPPQVRAACGAYGMVLRTIDLVHRLGKKGAGGGRYLRLGR
jgi:predicted xylose isomerase-like sugar epimerase